MRLFAKVCVVFLAFLLATSDLLAAVALDVFSVAGPGTTNLTWTHTPVGTPRNLTCVVVQVQTTVDEVTGVTADGNALTEHANSPISVNGASIDDGVVHLYSLGTGIPDEPLSMEVAVSGSSNKKVGCVTLTANADTEFVDVDSSICVSGAGVDPQVTLSLSSRTSFGMVGAFSGVSGAGSITPLNASWTTQNEDNFAGAGYTAFWYTYDTIGSSDFAAGVLQANDELCMFAFAISEVAGGGGGGGKAGIGSFFGGGLGR